MRNILNIVVVYISVTALFVVQTMPAYAGLVGTDQFLAEQVTSQDREVLYELLNRDEAQKLLEKNGVSKEQAQERIAALTNEEVRMFTQKFEELPAAGGIGAAAAILILVLLAIILALGK